MPPQRDCHCKNCSTNPSKRAKDQKPQPQRQTAKVFKISASDIFPVFKLPARIFTKIPMPSFIRIEKCDTPKHYERGWTYVETRHGRLVKVRNKKDGHDLHRGGWIKTKPRERIVKEVLLVERDDEPEHRGRRVEPCGGQVFIDVATGATKRKGSEDSDGAQPPAPRPGIRVRRPLNAHSPSPGHSYERVRPERRPARVFEKIPVQQARLERVRPVQVMEESTYCDDDEHDYVYEEQYKLFDMETREPRPYHIPEPENSFWDDDLQAWMVQRKPRVRFE
ncbi:hypothetical protein A1O7_07053 [Cladophialophora yegresii CBS 114405]|uniref:Uncharacterized protein n=1 Tax=Cladophialophora yegresii CBS 114405 TaxID=1182544 RepID=W9WDV3_9EURO|nr:uncharacterized protein A1O7_07053 [Cladophialophora yegresii CBS 114405]EXJ56709.1 hypothetical protein A1O7_07053 [Cladophialophora yegresii CBS 114405]